MRVSIVLAVLNSEATIADCLDSIIAQLMDVEIIVIDGGSTDATLKELEAYQQYIAYMETGLDSGIVNAFNRGVDRATGDIIAILNSDDYWEDGVLPMVVELFQNQAKVDVVHGWCRFIVDGDKGYIKKPNMSAMKRYMSAYHCTMFVRASLYDRIGRYNEHFQLAMDSEWVHRAMQADSIFYEIPQVLTNMRMGGVSDRRYYQALVEYRESVIMHGLAGRVYAGCFLVLHLGSKLLSKMSLYRKLKRAFDWKYNKTVGIT